MRLQGGKGAHACRPPFIFQNLSSLLFIVLVVVILVVTLTTPPVIPIPSPSTHASSSPGMATGFLRKHYGLTSFTPQENNFVVFHQYFDGESSSPQRQGRRSRRDAEPASAPTVALITVETGAPISQQQVCSLITHSVTHSPDRHRDRDSIARGV